jgi:heme O synthase-like polyprenyltransferase
LAYFIVACAVSLIWFIMGVQGFFTHDEVRWARKTFLFSILTIMILCMMMLVKNH